MMMLCHGCLLVTQDRPFCLLQPVWEEQEENERIEAYARMKRQQEEKLAAEKDRPHGHSPHHVPNTQPQEERELEKKRLMNKMVGQMEAIRVWARVV